MCILFLMAFCFRLILLRIGIEWEMNQQTLANPYWLVVDLPLWKMTEWKSVGMMKFPTKWKFIKLYKNHIPNHQPAYLDLGKPANNGIQNTEPGLF